MAKLVILVPGWSSLGKEFKATPLFRKLWECGYDLLIFRNFDRGMCDMQHNANKLAKKIQEFDSLDAYDEIHLIGHSMGGIVARLAEDLIQVESLTTIASPHLGSPWAQLAPWSKAARQMRPSDSFLDQLPGPFARSFSVGCAFDLMVPAKNAIMPRGQEMIVNHTHSSVLFSNEVANSIVKFIAEGKS